MYRHNQTFELLTDEEYDNISLGLQQNYQHIRNDKRTITKKEQEDLDLLDYYNTITSSEACINLGETL